MSKKANLRVPSVRGHLAQCFAAEQAAKDREAETRRTLVEISNGLKPHLSNLAHPNKADWERALGKKLSDEQFHNRLAGCFVGIGQALKSFDLLSVLDGIEWPMDRNLPESCKPARDEVFRLVKLGAGGSKDTIKQTLAYILTHPGEFQGCFVQWLQGDYLGEELWEGIDAAIEGRPTRWAMEKARQATMKPAPVNRETNPKAAAERLSFDDLTKSVTLDRRQFNLEHPKAYNLYKFISECKEPITRAKLRLGMQGLRGDKTIPNTLKLLPNELRNTIKSGHNGYWLKLPQEK